MASESQVAVAKAEGNISVLAKELDYSQKYFAHPSYRLAQQFSNTFGQPLNITPSQISSTINVPPEVHNWAKSYLGGFLNIPAPTAGNYIWTYADIPASGVIQHLQHFCQTNQS